MAGNNYQIFLIHEDSEFVVFEMKNKIIYKDPYDRK